MGFQFQSVASVSPFLIDERAIDRPVRPSVPAECHGLLADARRTRRIGLPWPASNVRFLAKYVRSSPNSRHSRASAGLPLMTQTGHR